VSRRTFAAGLALVALAAATAGGAWAAPKIVKPFAPGNALAPDAPRDAKAEAAATPLPWRELEAGLAEAKKAGKPILVDVVTDWCGWCKRMDRTTYADAGVRDYLSEAFVPVRVDAEEEGRRATYGDRVVTYRQFADGFGITGYPTTVFLAADGTLITTVPGFVQPERFLLVLHYIGDGHYKTQPWDVYAKSRAAESKP
jgi:thioredoxin-related protein